MSFPLSAQFVCGLIADEGGSAWPQSSTGDCLPTLVGAIAANPDYLPTVEPGEGVKTIRLVFHSIKYAEGNPLNFEEQDKFFFHELVDVLSRNIYGEINCPIFNTSGGCFCDVSLNINCSNNVMSYANVRNWFSPLQLAQMHRVLLGSWRSRMLHVEYDPAKSITINDNQTWDHGRVVEGDITIMPGATLTIKCKVIMPPDGIIYVEKGGTLNVDGGHLTISSAKCAPYWGGILVKGDPAAPQAAAQQGRLLLNNDALVEFADVAARVFGGGIVQGSDSRIENCRYGVYMEPYQNPSSPGLNLSYFYNCAFAVTDDFAAADLNPFVSLNGLAGRIRFNGCSFLDQRIQPLSEEDNYGYLVSKGIQSMNSRFQVSGNSTFSRLLVGIEAGASGSARNFSVRDATFQDCYLGVLSRAVNFFTIRDNTFRLGGYDLTPIPSQEPLPAASWHGAGLSIEAGSGFILRGNDFVGPSQRNTLGIFALATGGAANTVENNTFTDVTVSNYAKGENYDLLNPDIGGLSYLCNDNQEDDPGTVVRYDFLVADGGGIASVQGRANRAAGNTFRPPTIPNPPPGTDFRNAPDAVLLNYFYYPQGNAEEPIEVVNVEKFEASLNLCSYDIQYDELVPGETEGYEQEFAQKRQSYLAVRSQYDSLLDGGSTAAALQAALQAGPADAAAVYSQLSGYAPFLSDTVLRAAAANPHFSQQAAWSLAESNPELLRWGATRHFLAAARSLTPAQEDSLRAIAASQQTARSALEYDLHRYYADMQYAGRRLIVGILADTLQPGQAALQARLRLQGDLASMYALAESYWQQSDTAAAWLVLTDTLPAQYPLVKSLADAHLAFLKLKALQQLVLDAGKGWEGLEAQDVAELEGMANDERHLAGAQARHILNFAHNYRYLNLPPLPDGVAAYAYAAPASPAASGAQAKTGHAVPAQALSISAQPNPARGWVAFAYALPPGVPEGELQVFDLTGRLIHRQALAGADGAAAWQPESQLGGLFLYRLIAQGEATPIQRLVLLQR
jgi:hypothetical protein